MRTDIQDLNIPVNTELADHEFFIPQPTDILIGADVVCQFYVQGE